MKNILRNFWVTMTRFKLASSLNILGLAVAFTVFAIIMMQTRWEFTYNRSIPDHQRIYTLEHDLMVKGNFLNNIGRPFAIQIADSSPALDSYFLFNGGWGYHTPVTVLSPAGDLIRHVIVENTATDGIDEVLGLKKLSGDFARFDDPSSVIMSRSEAMRLFGTIDAADKQLFLSNDTLFVAAVFEDFPTNCTMPNGLYVNLGDENIDQPGNWNYRCYFKLKTDNSLAAFKADFNKVGQDYCAGLDENPFAADKDPSSRYRLIPLGDIYFELMGATGNYALSSILIAIAILIILIAMINFINFFMALVPIRIQSVNIQKIFGTPVFVIRINVIAEAVGTVLLSYFLSLVILQLLQGSAVTEYVSCSLFFADNAFVMVGTAIVALMVGLLAGIYPAYYITKFPPMMVLRGAFGRSKAGTRLRSTLVVIQYTISIALIIGSLFIATQTSFMRSSDMGYNRERLLTVNVASEIAQNPDALLDLLRKNPDIIDVAYSASDMTGVGMSWARVFKGQDMFLYSLPVSWNFPEFIGFKFIDGRAFIKEDATKTSGTMIINETAAKKYGIAVGDFINGHAGDENPAEVVGIVKDFNFTSLKFEVEPIVIYEFGCSGWYTPSTANIRIAPTADYKATTEYIASAIKQLRPSMLDDQIVIKPFDETVEKLYQNEDRLNSIITIFSLVAILISLVGVFGLVVFEVQYRRKEIALRKVHGASFASIPMMINRKFVVITAISALLAVPATYIAVWYWLQGFAAKTPLVWWIGVVAVLLVWLITVILVTFQTLKAAAENPIKALSSNS